MDVTESLQGTEPAALAAALDDRELVPAASEPGARHGQHVELRTVVLPELKILYLPVLKAGCTSLLWLLSRLAGIPAETFTHSVLPGVSPALTVHDMSLWGAGHRLADYEGAERERLLAEDGWLRFSVVRHPATRLWSAWQSKLLLREPRFAPVFGDQPWFPRVPSDPEQVIDDFRRFVAAVADGEAVDAHWAVQHDIVTQLPLDHVGRLESLDDTHRLLRQHVPPERWPEVAFHENRAPLPFPATAFDRDAASAVNEHYRADFEHFGYEPVEPSDDAAAAAAWAERVTPVLPVLKETIDRHVRIEQLHRLAVRARTVDRWFETATVRRVGHARSPVLTNHESQTDFNVHWSWAEGPLEHGFTAVVRAKNEERALPWVLPPLLRAVRKVVVIDNGSTDATVEVAKAAALETGAADRLEVHSYPFAVARCGEEHLGTPAGSVHSLVYFYNWSFSHVRTRYALKWDADMVLTDTAVRALRDLAWQLEASDVVVKIPRYPLYVADERRAFLDVGLANCEPWAWPNRPGYSFVKAMEWEQPLLPPNAPRIILPDWSCVELKYLDADEFDHWSDTDFHQTARTQRKRREWEVFRALADGGEPPADVIPVESPEGTHVIDHVRAVFLPEKENDPGALGERIIRQLARI